MRQLCAVEPPAPWQVLAVTFTNKAAKELRERLEAFGIAGAGDIWALTFHSACVRILRRDIDKLGFSNDFTIYDTDDCKRVVKDILKEMDLDEKTFSPREVLSVISKAKDELLSPQDFSKKWAGSGDWKRERVAKIYARYDRILCEANALDFDDLIPVSYTHLDVYKRQGSLPALSQCFFAFALSDLTRMARTATPRACSSVKVSSLSLIHILFQQGYLDYTSGNPKAFLKLLYRGRRDQTYADLNKVLRIEITEDSPAVEIYNEDGKAGEWDFQNLNRVTESDRIFELCRGGGRSRQYLALPKDALREGTVEEFRSCMDRWLKGDKTVEYYDISERRQKQLMKAKYQLFKH